MTNIEVVVQETLVEVVLDAVAPISTVTEWGNIIGDIDDQTDLGLAFLAKQDTLVSGTNIKTVNSNSLLGAGDIPSGDMYRYAYDTDNDGIVDQANKIDGGTF